MARVPVTGTGDTSKNNPLLCMKISIIKQKQHIQFTILYMNITDTIRKVTKLALQHMTVVKRQPLSAVRKYTSRVTI